MVVTRIIATTTTVSASRPGNPNESSSESSNANPNVSRNANPNVNLNANLNVNLNANPSANPSASVSATLALFLVNITTSYVALVATANSRRRLPPCQETAEERCILVDLAVSTTVS